MTIVTVNLVGSIAELMVRRPRNFPNIDLTKVTTRGNTALHVAAQDRANANIVEAILRLNNSSVLFVKNMNGDTPLHVAARLGNSEIANRLVSASGVEGAKYVGMRNVKNNTALHEAVRNGHYKVGKLLMDKCASLDVLENETAESLLFMAVDREHLPIAQHILQTFPDCSVFGSHGLTAIHAAVLRSYDYDYDGFPNFSRGLRYFRPCRFLIDLITKESFHGFLKELIELRGHGILETKDDIAWMPHHYAAAMGKRRILQLFLSKKNESLAYKQDNEGMSALHISAKNGKVSVVRLLVEKFPDVCELLDNSNRTALHIAAQHKQADVVRIFLSSKAFTDLINEQDNEGNTALHLAAVSEHCEIIILLSRVRRLNISLLNNEGMTAYDIINKSSMQLGLFEKVVLKFYTLERRGPVLSLRESAAREANVVQTIDTPNTTQPMGLINASIASSSKDESTGVKSLIRNTNDQMADIILLVATIIAGITFTAAITMPGGYDSSNGLAILRGVSHFKAFLVFDSLAFGCAAGTMLIHFAVSVYTKLHGEAYKYPIQLTMLLTLLSITSTVLAFVMSTNAVLYEHDKSHESVSHFGLPGDIAFFAFIGTFLYFFLPLIATCLYYFLLQVPDDYLPVPVAVAIFMIFRRLVPKIRKLIKNTTLTNS